MRQLAVTVVALLLTAPPAAHAQGRQGGNNRPAAPPPTRPNVPPPPITYPFGPLMPPPAGGLLPRAGEGPPFRTGRSVFFPRGSTAYAPFIFGYPDSTSDQGAGQRSASRPAQAMGLLRLSVTPGSAHVFVDSLYVGTVDDVNAQGGVIQLEAGPHRLEFRAPGYATHTVDVRINPLETVTYRATLDLARPPAATAPTAAAPTVMYVIPNCYLGNLPPRQSRLPSGCDVKQVQVLKPTAAAVRP